LKAFLQISDGLALNWKIRKNDMIFSLGQMHLNKLRDIKKIQGEHFTFSTIAGDDSADEDESEEER
jgi:hypothetical protein